MKGKYDELRKKYKILPEYEEINKEFNIAVLDKIDMAAIRKKVGERLELCLDVLERILNPEPTSLADLYECRFLTSGEKEQAFDTFKKLMQIYRTLLEADLTADEEEQAKTISKICNEFPELRKQIIPLVKKLKESWREDIEHKELLGYLG